MRPAPPAAAIENMLMAPPQRLTDDSMYRREPGQCAFDRRDILDDGQLAVADSPMSPVHRAPRRMKSRATSASVQSWR